MNSLRTSSSHGPFQSLEILHRKISSLWKFSAALLLVSNFTVLVPSVRALVLASETFDSSDANWTDRDINEMSVAFSGFGTPGGSLHGNFALQAVLAFESDAFRAGALASGGAFNGDYYTTYGSFNNFNFVFYAEDVLPSTLIMRIGSGANTFLYNLTPQVSSVGNWNTVNVSLAYSAGWLGGNATLFSNAFNNISFIDVQIARNGTGAQDYYLDNFTLNYDALDLNAVVPEPSSFGMILVGLFALRVARKYGRANRLSPR